ncbi:MAG: hypothetical protein ACOCUU_02050 [Nanoarchaeota archaeon]
MKKSEIKDNKKIILFGMFLLIGIFSLGLINSDVSYCCEKTTSGAWCQNAPQEECDVSGDYRKAPTSCESTSYCKMGTCYDKNEGTCLENTPQKICEEDGGIWNEGSADEIPQCGLGCCVLGDQAAFVTQTRCSSLSSLYGLEINYRTDITSELQCIRSATSDVKGACVEDDGFDRRCELLKKRECYDKGGNIENSSVEFYEGYLCTAPELETICGPSEKTTCVQGRDEVYYLDTCGNLGNIYDASKQSDMEYWTQIKTKSESCNSESGNANSATCGNCDYMLGSSCGKASRTENTQYGDYICKDLSCEYQGKKYEHGESWCETTGGVNKPGGRYFRLVCYNSEVMVEPCADFRQEICIQDSVNGYSTAACSVNKWQDCTSQTTQKNCENTDKRDCKWIEDANLSQIFEQDKQEGACVPEFTPGFDFWGSEESERETNANEICSQGTVTCVVKFKKEEDIQDLLGGDDKKYEVKGNYECWSSDYYETGNYSESWLKRMNNLCTSLGDCGVDVNFVGDSGFNELEDLMKVGEAAEKESSSNSNTGNSGSDIGEAAAGVTQGAKTLEEISGDSDEE